MPTITTTVHFITLLGCAIVAILCDLTPVDAKMIWNSIDDFFGFWFSNNPLKSWEYRSHMLKPAFFYVNDFLHDLNEPLLMILNSLIATLYRVRGILEQEDLMGQPWADFTMIAIIGLMLTAIIKHLIAYARAIMSLLEVF
ncbi:hypothetical protein KCU81_g1785, partial [Aureobasidium melanogenum]